MISHKYTYILRLGFNKAILWEDNKLKIIDIIKQSEVNIELSDVDILVNEILSKYKIPEYTYIDYRIKQVATVKMMSKMMMENEVYYGDIESFFTQSFIEGSKSWNLFMNYKRKKHLEKHGYEATNGTVFRKLIRDDKKDKIYLLYKLYARRIAEKRIKKQIQDRAKLRGEACKDKDKERHKQLEIERREEHLSIEYMRRWYPEFYS